MSARARTTVFALLALGSLALPSLALAPAGASTAAGLIGLGGLGAVLVTLVGGYRMALLCSLALGITSGLAVMADGRTLLAVVVMVLVAVGQGLASRLDLQRATLAMAITVAFVVAEDPSHSPVAGGIAFGMAMGGYALATASITTLLTRQAPDHQSHPPASTPSLQRSWGYAANLAIAATATTAIAVTWDWGHTGGWLIMTPFIVMLPHARDSFTKALSRGAGTVGGFAIAMTLDWILGPGALLTMCGVGFAVLAVVAIARRWKYTVYAMVLTPAIVIMESIGRSVEDTAHARLVATLLGVVIALGLTALAYPVDRILTQRAQQRST